MPIPGLRRFLRIERGRATIERDLDEELRFHFEMTVEELVKRGTTPDQARREAGRKGDRRGPPRVFHAMRDSAPPRGGDHACGRRRGSGSPAW